MCELLKEVVVAYLKTLLQKNNEIAGETVV
jgi:hypothetical protein